LVGHSRFDPFIKSGCICCAIHVTLRRFFGCEIEAIVALDHFGIHRPLAQCLFEVRSQTPVGINELRSQPKLLSECLRCVSVHREPNVHIGTAGDLKVRLDPLSKSVYGFDRHFTVPSRAAFIDHFGCRTSKSLLHFDPVGGGSGGIFHPLVVAAVFALASSCSSVRIGMIVM
jgi:hypothetical protein